MFQNFKSVGYWGFYESALMFGLITAVYSLVECFARGFDEFANIIKAGDLDRILVRPVGIIHQIFGTKIELSKILRVLLGITVIIISLIKLNIEWTFTQAIVLIATFICGCLVIWGVMLIGAGISIFSVENLEFINIFTNGAKEIAFYPINIYNKWLSRIFTFIIPVACFNYLPISYLMGYGELPQVIYALSPLGGVLFIIPCLLFFTWALKRYQSTGT
jgi:ABC-2 type transport system permease protein